MSHRLVYDSRRVATRVRPPHRWASWRRNGETDECDSVVRRAPDGDRCVYARAEKASGAGADKKEKKEKKDKKEKKEKKEKR